MVPAYYYYYFVISRVLRGSVSLQISFVQYLFTYFKVSSLKGSCLFIVIPMIRKTILLMENMIDTKRNSKTVYIVSVLSKSNGNIFY